MQACLPFNLIQPIEVRLTHSDHVVGSPVSTALVHLTRTQMAIRELTVRSGNSRANTIVQILQKKPTAFDICKKSVVVGLWRFTFQWQLHRSRDFNTEMWLI